MTRYETDHPGPTGQNASVWDEAAARAVPALACAVQFMVVLDVSVVNVALPSIQAALGFDPVHLQWVANAYALVFAGFLLLGGRLADLYGRRAVFVAGLALFTAASLVGGLAADPGLLVAARAAQGLGAAVLAPATLTILTTTFPEGAARTRALATWTAVGLVGGAAGNLVGGLLAQAVSWRAILLVNVPIGAVAIVLAHRVPAGEQRHAAAKRGRLDVPGAVAVTGGLVAVTYGVGRIPDHGWSDPATAVALVAGGVALVVFAVVEMRFAPVPLLPPRLLRNRAIWVGNTVTLLAGACFQIPMWYFLAFFMQDVLGFSAWETGLGFLPHTLVTMLVGWRVSPWIMRYVDARTLIVAGALIAAAGFAWQSRLSSTDTYLDAVLGPAIVISVGAGLLNTPLTVTVTSGAGPADAGAVSGLMNTAKQIGGALGLAVLITLTADPDGSAQPTATGYGPVFWSIAAVLVVVAAAACALPARPPR